MKQEKVRKFPVTLSRYRPLAQGCRSGGSVLKQKILKASTTIMPMHILNIPGRNNVAGTVGGDWLPV